MNGKAKSNQQGPSFSYYICVMLGAAIRIVGFGQSLS